MHLAKGSSLFKDTKIPKHRIYTTSFANVYPHYVAKAEKKDFTQIMAEHLRLEPCSYLTATYHC